MHCPKQQQQQQSNGNRLGQSTRMMMMMMAVKLVVVVVVMLFADSSQQCYQCSVVLASNLRRASQKREIKRGSFLKKWQMLGEEGIGQRGKARPMRPKWSLKRKKRRLERV